MRASSATKTLLFLSAINFHSIFCGQGEESQNQTQTTKAFLANASSINITVTTPIPIPIKVLPTSTDRNTSEKPENNRTGARVRSKPITPILIPHEPLLSNNPNSTSIILEEKEPQSTSPPGSDLPILRNRRIETPAPVCTSTEPESVIKIETPSNETGPEVRIHSDQRSSKLQLINFLIPCDF